MIGPWERREGIVPPYIARDVAIGSLALTFENNAAASTAEGARIMATDRYVHAALPLVVERLDFASLAVIEDGRAKPPRSLGEFSFVPVRNRCPTNTLYTSGTDLLIPPRIQTTYNPVNRRSLPTLPYADCGLGIGLARGDWLVALTTAGVDDTGALHIRQIQDVSKSSASWNAARGGRYASGLYDGFRWRETLLAAWVQTAYELGVGTHLTVQSSAHNDHPNVHKKLGAYDIPAQNLGFLPNQCGNFELPLPPATFTGPDEALVLEAALNSVPQVTDKSR